MDVTADPLSLLRLRTSEKWRTFGEDVLPLFVAEMDYPLAEPIKRALHAAVDRSDSGYVCEHNGFADAFAGFARRRWQWQIDPAHVTTTTDVSVAIVESLRQVIVPGDTVVINPPIYPPFFDLVPEAGGVVREVPLLQRETGWSLDLDGLEQAFAAGARAYLLCNPHNPLGHPHSVEELSAVALLAAQYDVTVISDEVHAPLTHSDGVFTPFLSVSPEATEYGICVTSASKAWNLAGLKCAAIVTASARMRASLDALPEEVLWRTSQLGLIAGIAAFTEGEPWLDGALRAIQANRMLLGELLDAELPGVGYDQPKASYLAWLDLRQLGWGEDPSVPALEQARVALNPGPMFGAEGSGFVRLNFACSPEVLAEAISRLAAVR
ncbi:MAG: aminotransferase class I/II-fold pyridoxal phosphate-dependent enzyme [Leifsonia sp.]